MQSDLPPVNTMMNVNRRKPALSALEYQIGGNHYNKMVIQPAEFIMRNNIPWAEGNAIKYLCRHAEKGGPDDIKKAIHYCQMILEQHYGVKTDNTAP